MSDLPTNPAMLKLAGAALGAYVLGRFKKGRTGLKFAMWLAGARGGMDPKHLLRETVLSLANSAEGKELIAQLRGPVLQAGRTAAAATWEAQVGALTKALEQRTAAITQGVQKA